MPFSSVNKTEVRSVKSGDVVPADRPEFVLTRTFDAPRELVYKMWTQPEYVKKWWGVEGSRIVVCELDVRPGGTFRIDMQASDGTVYVNRGVYREVVENERIVTRDDRDAAEAPGDIPAGTHTVTFDDIGGKTRVTLVSRFASIEERDFMVQSGVVVGIGQSLKRLERIINRTMLERNER
jgi:uncharacterized protein YndB with AHSA1/START domain